eukprot:5984600-Heterocapsa_arctica.AAC.1
MRESGCDNRSEYYRPLGTGGDKERTGPTHRLPGTPGKNRQSAEGEVKKAVGPEAAQLLAARTCLAVGGQPKYARVRTPRRLRI